jgi:type VI secretion system protein ImpK
MNIPLTDYWMPVLERTRLELAVPGATGPGVSSALCSMIDAAGAAARRGGFSERDVVDAQFAVVAWIDETAMTFAWDGSAAWRAAPLQRRYFGTARAGVEFFQKLEALTLDAHAVREVFALVLVAGFQGQFAGHPKVEFATYRNKVIDSLLGGAEVTLFSNARLFPSHGEVDPMAWTRARRRPWMALAVTIGLPLVLLAMLYGGYESSLNALVDSLLTGR